MTRQGPKQDEKHNMTCPIWICEQAWCGWQCTMAHISIAGLHHLSSQCCPAHPTDCPSRSHLPLSHSVCLSPLPPTSQYARISALVGCLDVHTVLSVLWPREISSMGTYRLYRKHQFII